MPLDPPFVAILVHTSYIDKKSYARSPLRQYLYLFHILRCVVKARFPLWQRWFILHILIKSPTHVDLNYHYEQTLVCVVISLFQYGWDCYVVSLLVMTYKLTFLEKEGGPLAVEGLIIIKNLFRPNSRKLNI